MATQENARRFLQKLAEDDQFRQRVQKDPLGALAEYGFHPDPKTIPAGGVSLPSSEHIASNLDDLGAKLTSSLGIVVFKA
ncbi:MAG TPA: NHLP-related RiPP peptide [Rhodanobacteraceae bacterium]|nr:NHLP-related RiPP peptide [Rhodanobacteraceae bacterium]